MSTEENTEEQKIEDPAMGFENLQVCLNAIMAGQFDGRFDKIVEAMDERREARKTAVMNQVHEVFGPDARVHIPMAPTALDAVFEKDQSEDPLEPRPMETNPFFKKVTNPSEPADNNVDEITPDVLEAMPLNNVEREMVEQGAVEDLPIERRGAIIGGLSAADMGE